MRKLGVVLILIGLFSSCGLVSGIGYGNRTIRGYKNCPTVDPVRWHYKHGTGRVYRQPSRRFKII